MKFRSSNLAASLATLGLAVGTHQAMAASPQDIEAYAGAAFGDQIVDAPETGRTMRLDDDATFGIRYTYWASDRIGLQLAGGITPSTIQYTQGGDTDAEVYTFDANLLLAAPQFQLGGHKVLPYAVIGAGYAEADAEGPIVGNVGTSVATLDDDGGFSANAGLGARLFITDSVYAGVDARYRYIDKLVKTDGSELHNFETTLSIGVRF